MIKFFLKSSLLVIILLFGVLIGMQQANDGMRSMQGEEGSLEAVFDWSEDREEVEVFGEKITRHDLKEKQKKLEEIEAFNFFSKIGSTIANGLKSLFQTIVDYVLSGLEKWIDMLFS